MNSIIEKLTEIETVAAKAKEAVAGRKQELVREMEKQRKQFDEEMDKETRNELEAMREELECRKDDEISKIREDANRWEKNLGDYFEKNHESLSQSLFQKIIRM